MLGKRVNLFSIFKYIIYLLLAYNAYLFFVKDLEASRSIFIDGMSWSKLIQGYSATIDTVSWLILLLIFELETYVIHEYNLKGWLNQILNLIKTVSYISILYSFYGYICKYLFVHGVKVTNINPCTLLGTSYTYAVDFDKYLPLNHEQCILLAQSTLYQISNTCE